MASETDPQSGGLPTEIQSKKQQPDNQKIDRISALQDCIDSLSLSMFEALRRLRDAVAPESGNAAGNNSSSNNESTENDFEEFWQSYRNGNPEVVAIVKKVSSTPPKKREDYIRIHAKVEIEKDAELVKKLAETVLQKSADIDLRVSDLPGMDRTRTEQMKYIEELIEKNHLASEKLDQSYKIAEERREQVRKFVRLNTCEALGITVD
jgi:hypothetical protein